jgi:hypothetical protein
VGGGRGGGERERERNASECRRERQGLVRFS